MKIQNDIVQFKIDNQLDEENKDDPHCINPIFPKMFASGIFVNSFSPKSDKEN